uniref:Uncharacterized protein n=1 Tax=Zooxanthella nutricula TaxID=1333877 RepID=A0A7S2LXE5_9DINO
MDTRLVEMEFPSGVVRSLQLPIDVRSGSRAVQHAQTGDILVLENGSSRVWRLSVAGHAAEACQLTNAREAARFRSSLGSRLLFHCVGGAASIVVTGTPGRGASTPWQFDLASAAWRQLPEAPSAILSSAAFVSGDALVIVGGWSKERGCHGRVQTLPLAPGGAWKVAAGPPIPWRRPGAGCGGAGGQCFVALGWMECQGTVGSPDFRLLRRNGAQQRARTSSSRLCAVEGNGSFAELSTLPCADSFEHNGELYMLGEEVFCIGRDHVQAFQLSTRTWRSWPLPRELRADSSNSWVKHCGSWAFTWLAQRGLSRGR